MEKEEDKSQIIDMNGKVVIDSSYNPEYFEDLEVWLIKSSLYDKNLKQISGDGYKIYHIEDNYFQWNDRESKTAGIMNEKGKILYKYTFQSDENFMSIDSSDKDEDLKDLYCVVNIENKKYGIVNCKNGKLVYDFGDKKIFSNGDNTFKIYNSSMSEVLDNIFINNDKVLYHSNGKNVGLTYRNGYLHINDYSNYQTSYLDIKTGKIVDKVDNTTTVELSDWEKKNDMTVYECETGVGLKSKDKVVVDCVWDSIRIFDYPVYDYLVSKNKKYIITKKDDSYYLVDLKNSKTIKEFKTKHIRNANNSPFIYYDDENDNYVIYNVVTDKEVTVKNDVDIWLRSNYVIVEEDNKYNYYNSDLKLIYTASEK